MATVTTAAAEPRRPGTGDSSREIRRLARGSAANFAGSVLASVATFVFTVVVTRGVDARQAGIFFSLTSAFVIVYSLARLGVPTGLVYFIARYRALGEVHRLGDVMRAALRPVLVMSLALAVACISAAPQIASALTDDTSGSTVALVRLLGGCLLFAALTDVGVGATRGFGAMRPLVLVDRIARPLAQLAAAVVVVALGSTSALGIGAAWALPFVPSAVVLMLWARRMREHAQRADAPPRADDVTAEATADVTGVDRVDGTDGVGDDPTLVTAEGPDGPAVGGSELRRFWRFTLPRSLGSVAQMALQRADIVIIGILRGPVDAAVYAAATRFRVFGQLGANAVSTTIQPNLAARLARDDVAAAGRVYRTTTVWLVALCWPVYLVSAVLAGDLLRLFGDRYTGGSTVVVVMSMTMLFATLCGNVDVMLVMAGRSSWTMANSFAALGVSVALNLLLVPPFGPTGAAAAFAVAVLVKNGIPLVQLALVMDLHPFSRKALYVGALAAGCFALLPLVARLLGAGPLGVVAVATVAGLGYAAVLWRFKHPLGLDGLSLRRRRAGRGSAPR